MKMLKFVTELSCMNGCVQTANLVLPPTTGSAKKSLHLPPTPCEYRSFSEISVKKRIIICNIFGTFSNESCWICRAAWSEDARHDLPLIACITYGENGFLETLGFFPNFQKVKRKVKNCNGKVKKKLKKIGRKKS